MENGSSYELSKPQAYILHFPPRIPLEIKNLSVIIIYITPLGDWRSWLARAVWDREVEGSSPLSPTMKKPPAFVLGGFFFVEKCQGEMNMRKTCLQCRVLFSCLKLVIGSHLSCSFAIDMIKHVNNI